MQRLLKQIGIFIILERKIPKGNFPFHFYPRRNSFASRPDKENRNICV